MSGKICSVLMVIYMANQAWAGLLGAGTGEGSCAAAPYRAAIVQWSQGCPPHAPCCSEFGYCQVRENWEAGVFRDCNGVSNGRPLEASAIEAENAAAAAGDPSGLDLLVVPAGGSTVGAAASPLIAAPAVAAVPAPAVAAYANPAPAVAAIPAQAVAYTNAAAPAVAYANAAAPAVAYTNAAPAVAYTNAAAPAVAYTNAAAPAVAYTNAASYAAVPAAGYAAAAPAAAYAAVPAASAGYAVNGGYSFSAPVQYNKGY